VEIHGLEYGPDCRAAFPMAMAFSPTCLAELVLAVCVMTISAQMAGTGPDHDGWDRPGMTDKCRNIFIPVAGRA
jgi:hypothetical protein